jgi:Tol biopolymer transport system component
LTHNQLSEHDLIWSSDGKRIAFSADGAVYLVNSNGTGLIPVVDDQYDTYPLAWSSSAEIIVAKYTDNQTRELYAVAVEGAHERFLTSVSSDMPATLSPDKQQVAYVSNLVIYVVNIDGSGRKALTEPRVINTAPDWQP